MLLQAAQERCSRSEARQMSASWGDEEADDDQLMFPSQLDEEVCWVVAVVIMMVMIRIRSTCCADNRAAKSLRASICRSI